jgi:hypothetical protein
MGGFGSGRISNKPSVEGAGTLILDVNIIVGWVRKALRSAGHDKLMPGSEVQTSPFVLELFVLKEPAQVTLRLNLGIASGTVWLKYDINHLLRSTGPQDYAIRLETTPCRFGGSRWWWVCPQTGRRVAKLYLPDGQTRFVSRGPGGYDLAYASQRENKYDRAHRRGRRIRRKLGSPHSAAHNPVPPKPPRMRRSTYARLRYKLQYIEMLLDEQIEALAARWAALPPASVDLGIRSRATTLGGEMVTGARGGR